MHGYCYNIECIQYGTKQVGVRNHKDDLDIKLYCDCCNTVLRIDKPKAKNVK